ncbi:GNAT family N-acetyltransferase [Streptomyces olivoreticuli]
MRTARLFLRPVAAEDLPAVERLWRDERVRMYPGGPVADEKITVRSQRLPGTPGAFAVTGQDTGTVAGMVTTDPRSSRGATEVSNTLPPEHWGRSGGIGKPWPPPSSGSWRPHLPTPSL